MARQKRDLNANADRRGDEPDLQSSGTVVRTLALVRTAAELGEMSIKDLSARMGLAPSTVHRLLQTFAEAGFVQHDPQTKRYRIGPELANIGMLMSNHNSIKDLARPFMRMVVDTCNEACMLVLYVPSTHQVSVVDVINSSHPLRYNIELDTLHSILWGATGRSVLAFLPATEREAALARNDPSPATSDLPPDDVALLAELETIRENGFVLTSGQKIPGAIGIGSPIFARDGTVLGSLCVTIPQLRHAVDECGPIIEVVRRHACLLSQSLGYSRPYPGERKGDEASAHGHRRINSGGIRRATT